MRTTTDYFSQVNRCRRCGHRLTQHAPRCQVLTTLAGVACPCKRPKRNKR